MKHLKTNSVNIMCNNYINSVLSLHFHLFYLVDTHTHTHKKKRSAKTGTFKMTRILMPIIDAHFEPLRIVQ